MTSCIGVSWKSSCLTIALWPDGNKAEDVLGSLLTPTIPLSSDGACARLAWGLCVCKAGPVAGLGLTGPSLRGSRGPMEAFSQQPHPGSAFIK